MAPALGEALAELVIHGKTDLPVGFLRKDRLFGKSKQPKQAN
jgi:glycine/D-amino acid oxidase-like deaminating enzyme